jgi:hypothetical protein
MSDEKCFLTGKVDCDLTDILFEGNIYKIDEDFADEHNLKALKQKIADKLAEKEKEKEQALGQLTAACETLGLSKEELGRFLLGGKAEPESAPATPVDPSVTPAQPTSGSDEDFIDVDGNLTSKIRANVNYEEGVVGTAAPFSGGVKGDDGKTVMEEGKKIKRVGDSAIVSKSNMGITTMAIDHRDGSKITKDLCRVDDQGNLVRSAVAGGNGTQSRECPLCRGTGFTRASGKLCPKCEGTGFILV